MLYKLTDQAMVLLLWGSCDLHSAVFVAGGIHPQPQTSTASLGKYQIQLKLYMTYDHDCWLCRAAISTSWWRWRQDHSHQLPQLVEEIAADTLAFRSCGAVEDMWFFTTSLKSAKSQPNPPTPPFQPAKYHWEVYQRMTRGTHARGWYLFYCSVGIRPSRYSAIGQAVMSNFCSPCSCPLFACERSLTLFTEWICPQGQYVFHSGR